MRLSFPAPTIGAVDMSDTDRVSEAQAYVIDIPKLLLLDLHLNHLNLEGTIALELQSF